MTADEIAHSKQREKTALAVRIKALPLLLPVFSPSNTPVKVAPPKNFDAAVAGY